MVNETRQLKQRSIWEDYPLELGQDYEIPEWSTFSGYKCPHSRGNVIPWVLIAVNEGGHDSTGVCLECAVDIARELGIVNGRPFQTLTSTFVPMTDHIHDYSEGEERCRVCGQSKPWRNSFG